MSGRNKMKQYLGLDIGGTAVKIGIINDDGEVLEKQEYAVAFDGYETPIIVTVIKSLHQFLKQHNLKTDNFCGIGVSATGQIDVTTGTVIGVGGNIKNWLNTNIKLQLEDEFCLTTTVMNDANCMILAEQWKGNAKGKSHAIGITIGTGIGGGIIVDKKILTGALGCGGEIGHIIIQVDGEDCTCGNQGCYEHYASTSALVRKAKELVKQEYSSYPLDQVNGRFIFSQAQEGNKQIQQLIDQWIHYVAVGAISLIHIFNPEVVVFGGGVSSQEEMFIEPLSYKIKQGLMHNFSKEIEIKVAHFANDAGMIGAVAYLKGEL